MVGGWMDGWMDGGMEDARDDAADAAGSLRVARSHCLALIVGVLVRASAALATESKSVLSNAAMASV